MSIEIRDVRAICTAPEGINLVARSYVKSQLKAGDEIILSMLEHHANIVPWQQIWRKKSLYASPRELSPGSLL